MVALNKRNKGFTIVELLIVIVVIGILALITITTFTGVTAKARNTERQADIKAIHGQIEAFRAEKGYYPTLAHINDYAGWVNTNMKGLDKEALKDPGNTATDGTEYQLSASSSTNVYQYKVGSTAALDSSALSACATTESTCMYYTLTSTLENGAGTFSKANLQ